MVDMPMAGNGASKPDSDLIWTQLNGRKILVVEDDADTRQMIQNALQMQGAQVRTADSAPAALETIATWRPDVLVSDIGLPGEDGYALLRRVRALPAGEGGGIPAIALTAFTQDDDRRAAHEAGFQRHMAKPVSTLQLAAAVALLVDE
jgi:CheY-like chemotaxis protein